MIRMAYCNPKIADVKFTFACSKRVLYAQSDLLQGVEYFQTLLESDLSGDEEQLGVGHEVPDDDSNYSPDCDDDGLGCDGDDEESTSESARVETRRAKRKRTSDRSASATRARYRTSARACNPVS